MFAASVEEPNGCANVIQRTANAETSGEVRPLVIKYGPTASFNRATGWTTGPNRTSNNQEQLISKKTQNKTKQREKIKDADSSVTQSGLGRDPQVNRKCLYFSFFKCLMIQVIFSTWMIKHLKKKKKKDS